MDGNRAPRILRFAGREATLGLVVMGVFGVLLLGVSQGLIVARVMDLLSAPGIALGGALTGALAVLLLWQVVRDWRRFRTLEIATDGTWRLRNPFGSVLHTLAPGDPRAVDAFEREAWQFLGTPRRARLSWLEIELPDGRRFRSARSTAAFQAEAKLALRAHVNQAGRPSDIGAPK
ncbi:hypothetical protein Hoch_3058 [Haliangium ochraceum DSM 14365]|uniref:Uncharacterized protein n=1 Tax=Haliangium ochraceum (strain DSM 14365 / JCM 11303 / SMP-2) TaxID=502025 RepID=D0LR56_HALO1|nr:hypothetical protein Hoch_3058 [Haliangium ochraceum DSM 14365]